jgi:ESX secretion system ATPase EccB
VLVVEKDTKTRYVLISGVLHPVLNYVSARLILGKADYTTREVSAVSLRGTPHGAPVGIPGGPESLPAPADLVRSPWVVCSATTQVVGGGQRPTVRLTVAEAVPGQTVDSGHGLLVRGPDQAEYPVWHGQRLRVTVPAVLPALGYASATPIEVGAGWLNAIPQGTDLVRMDVPGRGEQASDVDGHSTRVGQVFVAEAVGSGSQYFVMSPDGLQPITATDAALLLGDPDSAFAYRGAPVEAIPISPAVAADISSGSAAARPGFPTQPAPPAQHLGADADGLCFVLGPRRRRHGDCRGRSRDQHRGRAGGRHAGGRRAAGGRDRRPGRRSGEHPGRARGAGPPAGRAGRRRRGDLPRRRRGGEVPDQHA